MFTGLVSHLSSIIQVRSRDEIIEITLERPQDFKNIKKGGSVAVDGVCLTIEELSDSLMTFALTDDTLKTTKWTLQKLKNKLVNLEQPLKVGDSLGGHWVTGHVDGAAAIQKIQTLGENKFMVIELPKGFEVFLWKKGDIIINGVSLTIQKLLSENKIQVTLIPETLKQTNLSQLFSGSLVTFEVSFLARVLVNYLKKSGAHSYEFS